MPLPRGLLDPALRLSGVVFVTCLLGWGALGALALPSTDETLTPIAFRFLSTALATLTILAVVVHLFARMIRTLRSLRSDDGYDAGYKDGYADGRATSPAQRNNVAQMPSRKLTRS